MTKNRPANAWCKRADSGGTEEAPGEARASQDREAIGRRRQQAWLSRQINDPFAAKARAHGYRSRAAYKLT
jgi:23S rRNA (uridine2552-2'-O)-methyltransferase